jgi:hypothetical protein
MFKAAIASFLVFSVAVLATGTVCASTANLSQIEATTDQGEKVILFPDGTWKFKEGATRQEKLPGDFISSKPPESSEVLVSNKGFAQIWYDPSKWTVLDESPHPLAEFFLVHHEGEAFATVAAERISVNSSEQLKNISLEMIERTADRLKILREEKRLINDREILLVRADISIQGIELAYLFYYWSGNAGNLVLSTWTGKNIFNDYSEQMMSLLSGLIITRN